MVDADLNASEWMLIREAVSLLDGGSGERNRRVEELHRKLSELSRSQILVLTVKVANDG